MIITAAILTGGALIFSLSSNFRMWKYAIITLLLAWLPSITIFGATISFLINLQTNLKKQQENSLFSGQIRGQSYLPVIGSSLLALTNIIILVRYVKALRHFKDGQVKGNVERHNGDSPTFRLQFSPRNSALREPYHYINDVHGVRHSTEASPSSEGLQKDQPGSNLKTN